MKYTSTGVGKQQLKIGNRHKIEAGSLEDVEPEECIEMIHEGIKMHLDEVEKCMAANGGPRLRILEERRSSR